jgi:hypothetical protein
MQHKISRLAAVLTMVAMTAVGVLVGVPGNGGNAHHPQAAHTWSAGESDTPVEPAPPAPTQSPDEMGHTWG